jgi:hypothetical protein
MGRSETRCEVNSFPTQRSNHAHLFHVMGLMVSNDMGVYLCFVGWMGTESSSPPSHGIVEGVGREGARREIEARFLKLPCTTLNYTLKQFKPISSGKSTSGWDVRSEASSRCSSSVSSKSGKLA